MNESNNLKTLNHHRQQELCTTRPAYRQGRKLTAVKTYTIANESQHLFIYGVPTVNLRSELKNLCLKYGQILALHVAADVETEIFTECYHVHYAKIQSARIAKRQLDNRSFYGGVLHVCYAPERESIDDTRAKLLQRSKDVLSRLYGTLEKNCDVVDKKTHLHENEIDPLEPAKKIRKVMAQKEEEEEVVVYGPQLPALYRKQEDGSEELPLLQSVCSNKVEKKIVFRKT